MENPVSHSIRAFPGALQTCRPASRLRSVGVIFLSLMLLFFAAHQARAHDHQAGSIVIEHPWSRATPPGAKVAAGYMVIRNEGSEPDRLVGATAEIAGRTEIHAMEMKDGVMSMRPVEGGVEIPAGGEVKLQPGSYHMMFMDLAKPLREGDHFAGSLTFEKAGTVAVEFAVGSVGAKPDHSGHDAGHGG